MMSISAIKEWWHKNEGDVTLGIGVFLLVVTAFLVGRVSIVSKTTHPVIIEIPDTVLQKQAELQKMNLVDLALPDVGSGRSEVGSRGSGIPEAERRGEYVASKNGAYYYTADMYMASRISPKNRVWFNSRQEAEARGLKPAKGL